jgi:hypothetical protein
VDDREKTMSPSDIFFLIAGFVGMVGGCCCAYVALTAKNNRMPEEEGLRPLLERFCGAIVDGVVVVSPLGRLALYDSFLVFRAPLIALRIGYAQVRSVELGTRPVAVLVKADSAEGAKQVSLFVGGDNGRVIEMIAARSVSAV